MEYVLMIGVALSGKTTYIESNFSHHRIALSHFDNDRKEELEYIEQCLKKNMDVVIDDTNLTEAIRKQHIDLGKKYHAKIRGIFMNTSQVILEKRQRGRRNPFPLSAIYKQLKILETPVSAEGFDELVVKKDYERPRET